ncbi:MAG: hypothetical protein OQK82_06460 [Candidatus Pacearchaeota archaeon]|nr:hypothetical protein [Candidatus Pacearchaeota archaeon]
MMNTKIIAVLAGFAVLVSLIGGGIRGVPILQILLRTIIWGVVFAGLGVGVSIVISKFLPELGQIINDDNGEEKKYQGEFEAIIPEENPHDTLNQDSMFADMRGDSKLDLSVQDESSELEELGSAENSNEDISPDNSRDNQEDFHEDFHEDQPENVSKDLDNVPYINEISEDDQQKGDNIDNLDALPEIDSFASSFTPYGGGTPDAENDNDTVHSNTMYSKPKTNLDVSGFVEDPEKTARAIHTWIERDKEG